RQLHADSLTCGHRQRRTLIDGGFALWSWHADSVRHGNDAGVEEVAAQRCSQFDDSLDAAGSEALDGSSSEAIGDFFDLAAELSARLRQPPIAVEDAAGLEAA